MRLTLCDSHCACCPAVPSGARRLPRRQRADCRRAHLASSGPARRSSRRDGEVGRLHHSRDELGREHLRDRDLARRRAVGRDEAAHQRPQVEQRSRLVARRQEAGVRFGSRGQAADLSDRSRRRRGAEVDVGRGIRRRVRLGTRRPLDRVHVERPAVGGAQGPREEVRRVRRHRRGPPAVASLRGRRRDEEDAAADERCVHRRPVRLVARQPADRVRPSHQRRSREQRLGRHLDRRRVGRRAAHARHRRRPRQQPAMVARRLADRVRDLDGEPEVLLHQPPHRDDPGGGRADRQPVGAVRRGPVDRALDDRPASSSRLSARAWAYLYRLDPATKAVTRLAPPSSGSAPASA